jgi:NYN domain
MAETAIFVDAGYLFAQGSTALTGSKKSRRDITLNETAVMAELVNAAQAKCPAYSLLRVYWYDGALGARPTVEQATLAHLDHIKLRLGFVSGSGLQKGVDSLIVTDLIELARNHAINDAVILSGDEDIRIGVQIAQSFGVRVHLIGITPSRGSQSMNLLQESDTTTEWDVPTVSKFLAVKASAINSPSVAVAPAVAGGSGSSTIDPTVAATIDTVVIGITTTLDTTAITGIKTYWKTAYGVPQEYDGKVLARSRATLGRDLSIKEKRYAREKFTVTVQAM